MPWDASLNKDLDDSLNLHAKWWCAFRRVKHLRDSLTDHRCFSKGTPKHLERAISRLVDPVTGVSPLPKRVCEDIRRSLRCLEPILTHEGTAITDDEYRQLRRGPRAQAGTGTAQWGGRRVKNAPTNSSKSVLRHADILPAVEGFVQNSLMNLSLIHI